MTDRATSAWSRALMLGAVDEVIDVALVLYDHGGRIIDAGGRALPLFVGTETVEEAAEAIIGLHIDDFEEAHPQEVYAFYTAKDTGKPYEYVTGDYRKTVLPLVGGRYYVGVTQPFRTPHDG